MNQTEFGYKLAEVRKARGLTQSELAEKCNVSYRTIQRIESGNVTPRGYTIKTLSAALDFDFLKLFYDNLSDNSKIHSERYVFFQTIIKQTIDLFNLKTKTMKKLSILTIILSLIGLGLFSVINKSIAQENTRFTNFLTIESNEEISKKEAVKIIDDINSTAKYHNKSIELLKTYAEKSDFNFDTYVLLAKLAGSFGHSTYPIMEIAQIVYFTNEDCSLFNDIAPLIFLNTSVKNDVYVQLSKRASRGRTKEEEEKIRVEIDKYKAEAKYKTLEEAFKNQ